MVIFIDFETSPKQKLFVSSQSLGSWTSINASIMTIFMAAFLTCQMVWKSLQETKRLPSLPMFPDNSYQLSSWSPLDGFHPPVEDFCRGQIATQNAIYSACFRHMFHLLGRRSIISDLFWSNYIYIITLPLKFDLSVSLRNGIPLLESSWDKNQRQYRATKDRFFLWMCSNLVHVVLNSTPWIS